MKIYYILKNIISGLKKYTDTQFGLINDYVVEQGTSGIWTYRKWNSGVSECWGNESYSGITINTAWGGLYEKKLTDSISYPNGLFTAIPCLSVTPTGTACLLEMAGVGSNTATERIYAVRPVTVSNAYITLNIHARGTWK